MKKVILFTMGIIYALGIVAFHANDMKQHPDNYGLQRIEFVKFTETAGTGAFLQFDKGEYMPYNAEILTFEGIE